MKFYNYKPIRFLMATFKELFITDLNRPDWLDALLRG